MNAISSIDLPDEDAAWARAFAAVNAWRGHALQCFAQTEAAVSETLLVMSDVPEKGSAVRLRRLVGHRFEDLRMAVSSDGPFAVQGIKVAAALTAFDTHQDLRPMLCHGVAKISLDQHGRWVLILKTHVFGGAAPTRSVVALEERDAETKLAELKKAGQRLASLLQSLRASLKD